MSEWVSDTYWAITKPYCLKFTLPCVSYTVSHIDLKCDIVIFMLLESELAAFYLMHPVFCWNAVYKPTASKPNKLQRTLLGILCSKLCSTAFPVLFSLHDKDSSSLLFRDGYLDWTQCRQHLYIWTRKRWRQNVYVCLKDKRERESEVFFTSGGMKSRLSVVICRLELDFRLAFLTVEPNREQETCAVLSSICSVCSNYICARPAASHQLYTKAGTVSNLV
jgi:hypothetical protein